MPIKWKFNYIYANAAFKEALLLIMKILMNLSVHSELCCCFSWLRQFELSWKFWTAFCLMHRRLSCSSAQGQLFLKLLLDSTQHDKQINLFSSGAAETQHFIKHYYDSMNWVDAFQVCSVSLCNTLLGFLKLQSGNLYEVAKHT